MRHKMRLILGIMLLLTSMTWAAPTLTYQGELSGQNGAISASFDMRFALYVDETSETPVWTETQTAVAVVDGNFTVVLGQDSSLAELGQYDVLYLGITVGDSSEMTPRMKVGSAIRAQWAAHAQDVANEDIHPRSVSIGDRLVIDQNGNWVGDLAGLRGPEGPPGPVGPAGSNGLAGPAGVGVLSAVVNNNGELILTLSNGQVTNAGNVQGPQGLPGQDGQDGTATDLSVDSDSDGFSDLVETLAGSNPNDGNDRPSGTTFLTQAELTQTLTQYVNQTALTQAANTAQSNLDDAINDLRRELQAEINSVRSYVDDQARDLTLRIDNVEDSQAIINNDLDTRLLDRSRQINTNTGNIAINTNNIAGLMGAQSVPYILGVTAQTTSGRISFNGSNGVAGAEAMCQSTYPNDARAHMCSYDEVVRAIASDSFNAQNLTAASGVETWTMTLVHEPNNQFQSASLLTTCQNYLYNAGDVGRGTGLTITANFRSSGGGGQLVQHAVNVVAGRSCFASKPILCCR